ncbi:GNAT family N-acetyltransferase [Vibrio parahaemolyticus]|uniref:GNAT family N-acetyltransferase n=1 Tax=Vibrio parahaemolyticus TaxID=670 RepID=UPI0003F5B8F6|nr:GNAT family protein [Vibrio parahaemolyticus]EHK0039716.1 GNAT family N-acetyltransferase [Vibrio parahaemolyticus]EJE4165212.1 GNAT family N-acetyltransferase [Vibrio parahaemolyticus]EJM7850432.1 GNAT family N-acetyltransferase [Vibrio parahaemolyticus]HBC3359709.1 GNAT family N-acetyltransferase [Vibrio parahaemolyticus]HBC3872126.1 GNAT family N-acetyltransferase [Vibrio parahaemolyticus]
MGDSMYPHDYQGNGSQARFSVSERVSIEPLTTKHATVLLEVVNTHRNSLSGYLPWTDFVTNRREAVNYISQRVNSKALDAHWCAIYFDEQFTGVIGIKGVDSHTHVTEIGYWLASNGRGHRVIDQVLAVLIPFLKQKGHAQFIQFHCMEDNIASINIAERAGATLKEYVDHEFETLDRSQRLGIYELRLT